jgi:hypothetical protein
LGHGRYQALVSKCDERVTGVERRFRARSAERSRAEICASHCDDAWVAALLILTIAVTLGATVVFVLPASGADHARLKQRRRVMGWAMAAGGAATVAELIYGLTQALSGLN